MSILPTGKDTQARPGVTIDSLTEICGFMEQVQQNDDRRKQI